MHRKKKTLPFLLIAMCMILCSCGKEGKDISPSVETQGEVETETVAEPETESEVVSVPETESEEVTKKEETVSEEIAEPESSEVYIEPEVVTVTISAAGDVTLGDLYGSTYEWSLGEMYDLTSPAYFFESVKPVFEADDMTIVNFEGVLTLTDERVEKKYNMKGKPEYIHILTEGDIEAVSFANNHRLDYGQQGCDDTIEAFESEGIAYAYDSVVGYYEVKGITIGFISFNEVYDGKKVETFITEGIETLKAAEVDLILACCHWGSELHNYPEDYQKELARMCVDLGADLVIGHHPHVIQGIDVYNGTYIVYSLGNFCFGGNKNPKDKDSMIFQQTFTFVDGVKQEDDDIRVIPVHISSRQNRNDYQPTLVTGSEAEKIIDRVNEYSADFGLQFDYEGKLKGE